MMHNYSVKLLIEGTIIILAIIIPGGLIAYFAWKAYKHAKRSLPYKTKEGVESVFPSIERTVYTREADPLDPYYRQP